MKPIYYKYWLLIYQLKKCFMKKDIHWSYNKDVKVECICGAEFTVNATVAWPIKTEVCYKCHPAFNDNKEIKKVVKGRMEKFLEKQKRIDAAKAS